MASTKPPAYVDHHGHRGLWQLEGHCGDCGAVVQRARLPKLCRGYYNGRPGGRCGFALSWVWIFYPASKV